MDTPRDLPDEFVWHIQSPEASYLSHSDPIRQSGFSGGPERWRAERGPILEAIDGDGDLLDVGCANGYLLECLLAWAEEQGRPLVPYGVDINPGIIEEARRRLPIFAHHFWVANAWEWMPPRQFTYVYALHDSVPATFLEEYVRRLLNRAVEPGGRLIVGAYGNRSRNEPPLPVADTLRDYGCKVTGSATGGEPPVTSFAWVDKA
ncbi:MAG: class I SAM-dependent methyltransferase [Dehalococcoidia bacterium]